MLRSTTTRVPVAVGSNRTSVCTSSTEKAERWNSGDVRLDLRYGFDRVHAV
jgi:hypothetical protein